ncbi:MAG TPA: NUDIX domain-containing protein [Acidimicrobiales bacterium]
MTFAAEPSTESLRALVTAHGPADERESSSRRRFLAELDRLPEPCSEAAGPVHVTASAIVVGRRGTVLHRHRRLGRWLQPGGHVEAGEDPATAAIRETTEETGLAVAHPPGGPRLVHVDVHDGGRGHTHLDLRFLVVAPDADPAPGPGESPDVAWYDWDAAAAIADDALIGALRAAQEAWKGGRSR